MNLNPEPLQPDKFVTIIQARTGSTRLPGKIMMPIVSKPLLARMVERVRFSKLCGTIVVATTTDKSDDPVEELCKAENILCFRGHPTDLLDRHYQVAKKYGATGALKIPSDVPLIDPAIIDKVIQYFIDNQDKYDYVSNLHPATYPDGNDVEVMTFAALENAWKNAEKLMEREHTTPYIWENPDKFRIGNVTWETGKDYSMSHRWTIDYPEDYLFVNSVYTNLYQINNSFGINDILDLLEKRTDICTINSKYAGVNWYRNHLHELKTIKPEQTKKLANS